MVRKTAGLLGLVLLAGCAAEAPPRPALAPVRGQVKLANGQPLPGGRLAFYVKGGQGGEPVAAAEIERDGTFAVTTYAANDGTQPGTYLVTVSPLSYKSGNPKQVVPNGVIPKAYLEPETTRLEVEVKAGDNQLALQLK